MMPNRNLQIAVIGDEDLVNGLRLAGITKYFVMPDGDAAGDEVRKTFSELMADDEIGIITLHEKFTQFVPDLLKKLKERHSLTPIVIEVPSKSSTSYEDSAEYYKAYVREFIGFDVEI